MTRFLTIAFTLGAMTAPALAEQPKKPDAAAIKKANGHFKLGQEFFKSGQWDRAIAEYQSALDLTAEPTLMVFNIALADDRAGRPEPALEGYLKYLEGNPDGSIADEARGYVAKLTPVVDKLKRARTDEDARKLAEQKRQHDEEAKLAELAKQADAKQAQQATRNSQADAIEHRGTGQRLGGLVGVGVGGLLIGYGAKKGFNARSISNELSDHKGVWTDEQIGRDREGRRANTQLIVFASIGGAVAVTRGVLRHRPRRSRARREVRVGVGPTSVAFRYRF